VTPTLRDHLELVRAPAALSVLGDTLAGAAAAGHRRTPRRLALPAASACLYAAGMALNDWADRDVDAAERPERPIPSGRVTPRRALAVAAGLGAAGLVLAGVGGGRRALAVAAPLAGCVGLYDAVLKDSAAGPAAMAACRGLDVLLGAGAGRLRPALPAAVALAAHTAGVTVLSRGEVHGTTRAVAASVAAGTGVVATAALAGLRGAMPADDRAGGRPGSARGPAAATVAATAAYLAACLPAQLAAAREPSAAKARSATGAGIRAMVPLQAAWAARAGTPGTAAALGGVAVVGTLLRRAAGTRAVSET
jgi:4-hydroxybenzoate polyprenyltransferase